MVRQIVQTKLNIPRLQSNHFSRERLLSKMDSFIEGSVVLVSAPAGYGKTALVSEWVSKKNNRSAWYSLSNEDNNLITFIYYLIEALKKIDYKIGDSVLNDVGLIETIGVENLFASLINDFCEYEKNITIVLDDYHMIRNPEIHRGINFILEHLPNNTSMILTTRNYESLPISRLRAKNRLYEISTEDLLFDVDEISTFLSGSINQKLSSQNIQLIEEKTEGWITSLHLFAMSLNRQDNPDKFVESFSGKHEYIFDYLLDEVFMQQTIGIRKFLMATSLFNRFNSSLASYLLETDEISASKILTEIRNSNLFLISLDSERKWYRYHHLFQEFLQKKFFDIPLKESLVLEVYDYASVWFEEQGFIDESIHNALIAKKYEYAARLMEFEWINMDRKLESSIWLEWVKQLPDVVLEKRPILNIGYAWCLLDTGKNKSSKSFIDSAWKLMNDYNKGDRSVIVDDLETFKMLPSIIYSAKAYLSLLMGDEQSAYNFVLKAKDNTKYDSVYNKNVINTVFALSLWCMGRITEALETIQQSSTSVKMRIQTSIAVGKMMINLGKLSLTQEHYRKIIDLVHSEDGVCERVLATCYHDLALIDLYRFDLVAAKKQLEKSYEYGVENSVQTWKYNYGKIHSLYLKCNLRFEDALQALDTAEKHYYPTPLRDIDSIESLRTNIYIEQNRSSLVDEYISSFKNEEIKEISFLNQNHYITLVKALIYKYKEKKNENDLKQAMNILSTLQKDQNKERYKTKIVDCKVLEAQVYLLKNHRITAGKILQDAIEIAETETYILPFVEAGEDLKALLSAATLEWGHKDFVLKIIKHINQFSKLRMKFSSPSLTNQLVSPLSQRELEVLHLISQGFTNDEISKTLYLAISTVKNYNQSLFGKLQVKNRTEAIKKALDLGII